MRNDSQEGDDDECQQNRSGRESGESLEGKIIFGCPGGKIIFRCLGGSYMSKLPLCMSLSWIRTTYYFDDVTINIISLPLVVGIVDVEQENPLWRLDGLPEKFSPFGFLLCFGFLVLLEFKK